MKKLFMESLTITNFFYIFVYSISLCILFNLAHCTFVIHPKIIKVTIS